MPDRCLTRLPLRLVIFDCDGVLIDSEPPSNRLVAAEIRAHGSTLSNEAVQQRFAGKALSLIAAELAESDGILLPEKWPKQMHRKLAMMLEQEATLIPGARTLLEAVLELGVPFRVASNSSHQEMEVKFRRTGLDHLLANRLHSAHDVGRPKPWPDLFLSVARTEGVEPDACLVVEDSDTGLAAARAAGMACIVLRPDAGSTVDEYAPPGMSESAPVVRRISHLDEVTPLLVQALRRSGRA